MPKFFEFSGADWARTEDVWQAWWHGELDRPLAFVEARDPVVADPDYSDFVTQFSTDTPVDAVLDYFQTELGKLHLYGDAYPKWWPNAGPGVMAAFLGGSLEYAPGTTWFKPLDLPSIFALQPAYLPDNTWWQRILALTQAACERWKGQVVVGHTDIGGTLDVLASLRGSQQLLTDLYDTPGEVERIVGELDRLWLDYYASLLRLVCGTQRGTAGWSPVWAPGTTYMLQCDFSYMISPKMFERFVIPSLADCCDALDYAFYHLDGKGEIPHLDLLLSLDRLRGIQWIPGDGAPPPEDWLPLLKRIRDGGKLCQVYVTREGALKIARVLGGRGFLFYVWSDRASRPCLTPPEAEEFMARWRAEGFA